MSYLQRHLFCSIAPLFLAFSARPQGMLDWSEYMKKIERADTLYQKGAYAESATAYAGAFGFNEQQFSEGDRYKAALAWAKAGQFDSALANLKKEVQVGFHQLDKLKREATFTPLKNKPQWKTVLQNVEANEKAEDKRLGKFKGVKQRLEAIRVLDQQYRKDYEGTLFKFGPASEEVKALVDSMTKVDANNLKYVSNVLDAHGWLDYKFIGHGAAAALFLVVQHADSLSQEKYLPLLQQAVKEKKAFGWDLALLEDRVLLRRGQKQVYGSQVQCDSTGKVCWLLPIEDERNVDERRKEVGLPPLADYVKHWNIVYKKSN